MELKELLKDDFVIELPISVGFVNWIIIHSVDRNNIVEIEANT
jgi:hypothetical protein